MALKDLTAEEKDALVEFCQAFVVKQTIRCPETVYQCDWVIENAYEFIEGVCNIVGYEGSDDDEDDD